MTYPGVIGGRYPERSKAAPYRRLWAERETLGLMRSFGWRYPLAGNWFEARAFLRSVDWGSHEPYPVTIAESVIESGAHELLAVGTSMHDLLVAPIPTGDPPIDVVVVRAPGSLRYHPERTVLIEYLSTLGAVTAIERPANEAIPLFWRFVEAEFGVRSPHGLRP